MIQNFYIMISSLKNILELVFYILAIFVCIKYLKSNKS